MAISPKILLKALLTPPLIATSQEIHYLIVSANLVVDTAIAPQPENYPVATPQILVEQEDIFMDMA